MAARLLSSSVVKFFLIFLLVLGIFVPQVQAQTQPKAEAINENNYNDELHGQRFISTMAKAGLYGLGGLCLTSGQKCYAETYGKDSAGNLITIPLAYSGSPDMGAIGMVTGVFVAMYNSPPVSSTEYLADLGRNIGIAPKEAYAQVGGSGQNIIRPVLKLWQVTRNVAYMGFIVIFIVAGFAIMFQRKAGAHSHDAVTAQQALPGLVIGLIFVTFSYFIAALIVDLAFVGVKLVAELYMQTGAPNMFGNVREVADNYNVFQLFGAAGFNNFGINKDEVFSGVSNTLASTGAAGTFFLPAIVGGLIAGFAGFFLGGPVGAVVGAGLAGGAVSGVAGALGANLVAGLASLIIPFILLVALMIQFFKVLFALIEAYIQILVYTVLGPFIIMFSAIPGNGGALTGWLRNLLGNALIFPAVIGMFFFAGLILGTPKTDWQTTLPLFGGLSVELVRLFIAYGILLGIPAIPNMVRQAVGAKGAGALAQDALSGWQGGGAVISNGLNRGYAQGMRSSGLLYRQAAYHKDHENALLGTSSTWGTRWQRAVRWFPGAGGGGH